MKLKSCPFCGQEGAGAHWDHGYWSVTCGYRHDGAPGAHCFQDWGEVETEEEAAEAWNRRAEAPNPPLTLDELRQMDGEPVWCVDGSGNAYWCLVNCDDRLPCCYDNETGLWEGSFYGMTGDGKYGLHQNGWRAYRRRLEEEK